MEKCLNPKIAIDFWGNLRVACQTRQRTFLRLSPPPLSPSWRGTGGGYGEGAKMDDNEVWQANRRFVK